MKTLRPFLSAVLGLMFLVQGVAVAAAPHAAAPAEMPAAAADAKPPCHGQADVAADPGAAPSCCDADCAHMAICLLGHLAAGAAPTLVLPPTARIDAGMPVAIAATSAPPFLLRPPIASHA